MTTLLAAACTFGEANKAVLMAKVQMQTTFLVNTLASEVADVTMLLARYQKLKGIAQLSTTQQTANRALYDDYQKMNRDA